MKHDPPDFSHFTCTFKMIKAVLDMRRRAMLILMHLLHCFLATCQYLLREEFLFCPSLLTQLKATKTAFIDDHSLGKTL